MCLWVCISACWVQKGQWLPWSWDYRWLWTILIRMLEAKLWSFWRVLSTLNHWAFSSVSPSSFWANIELFPYVFRRRGWCFDIGQVHYISQGTHCNLVFVANWFPLPCVFKKQKTKNKETVISSRKVRTDDRASALGTASIWDTVSPHRHTRYLHIQLMTLHWITG